MTTGLGQPDPSGDAFTLMSEVAYGSVTALPAVSLGSAWQAQDSR